MRCHKEEIPVLVGTASVRASEELSNYLKKENIAHNILNAKNHANEAQIIAEAGKPAAVTVATNMAGRGTDIVLGGNLERELQDLGSDLSKEQGQKMSREWQERHDKVLVNGGLRVIGGERHESRRIDNQLRGRCGRQGDPGSTRFYLSMEDDLLRLFASERVSNMMQALGLPAGEAIEHKMVTNAIERAQRKVEGRNFDIRKQLLEYDDVANNQRQIIYEQRLEILQLESLQEVIAHSMEEQVRSLVLSHAPHLKDRENKSLESFREELRKRFNYESNRDELSSDEWSAFAENFAQGVYAAYKKRHQDIDEELLQNLEKQVMLQVLDMLWRQHLQMMDYLRQGIHLRGYAQKNPKEEYKKESYLAFENLLERIKTETVRILCHLQMKEKKEEAISMESEPQRIRTEHRTMNSFQERVVQQNGKPQPFVRTNRKIGRNEPCPCGSEKKYKHCHGKIDGR